MSMILKAWFVDASPGSARALAKCGEKFASTGIAAKSTLTTPIGGPFHMTDTIVLNSFPYLVGKTVQICLGGLDCGDHVVAADGSVTISYGSDPGGLLTPGYLTSISSGGAYGDSEILINIVDSLSNVTSVYVPCVVGYGYTSRVQLLRNVTEDEMKTKKGPGTGKLARTFKFSLYLWNAVKVKMGTSFDHLMTQKLTHGNRTTQLASNVPFTGIHEATIDDKTSFDGQLCWQVDRPFPLGVVSATTFQNTEDR
jgi:hypothetical protein